VKNLPDRESFFKLQKRDEQCVNIPKIILEGVYGFTRDPTPAEETPCAFNREKNCGWIQICDKPPIVNILAIGLRAARVMNPGSENQAWGSPHPGIRTY
jgi:hypothetical protein